MTIIDEKLKEPPAKDCLQQIQEDYSRLSDRLAILDQLTLAELSADADQFSDLLSNIEERTDQIQHKMYNIAWIVAGKPAITLKTLAIKANILLEQCEEDEEQLTVSLTRSLCNDLISFSEPKD